MSSTSGPWRGSSPNSTSTAARPPVGGAGDAVVAQVGGVDVVDRARAAGRSHRGASLPGAQTGLIDSRSHGGGHLVGVGERDRRVDPRHAAVGPHHVGQRQRRAACRAAARSALSGSVTAGSVTPMSRSSASAARGSSRTSTPSTGTAPGPGGVRGERGQLLAARRAPRRPHVEQDRPPGERGAEVDAAGGAQARHGDPGERPGGGCPPGGRARGERRRGAQAGELGVGHDARRWAPAASAAAGAAVGGATPGPQREHGQAREQHHHDRGDDLGPSRSGAGPSRGVLVLSAGLHRGGARRRVCRPSRAGAAATGP